MQFWVKYSFIVLISPCVPRSAVKERVVWVDTKRTRVKGKSGKLKEKEVTILEVRVKAQHPGERQCQEVLYSTESNTDRSFCRSGVDIIPWRHTQPGADISNIYLANNIQFYHFVDLNELIKLI